MKERLKAGVLKESAKNKDVNGAANVRDIKDEVKEEAKGHSARSTPDSKVPTCTADIKPAISSTLDVKPPSNKMANGEADTPKSEDSNKNKIVTEAIKEENGGPMSVGSDNKKSPAGMGSIGTPGAPAVSRSDTSVPGFIQQQSTIFVFSVGMANQAAESVKQGNHKSIINYHMENHPQQSVAQRSQGKMLMGGRAPMYSNLGMKQVMPGMGPAGPTPDMGVPGMACASNAMGGPSAVMGGPGIGSSVEQWVQEQNANLQQHQQQAMTGMPSYSMTSTGMGPSGPNPGPAGSSMYPQGMMSGPGPMGMAGGGFPMMESQYEFNPDAVGPGGAVSMPHINLSQNKVPNESLTPEQLKNRSEKFGRLSKIKGSLEMRGLLDSGGPSDMFMGSGMSSQQTMMSQQQAMMSQHQVMMGGPGPSPGPHPGMMSPSQQYMMQQQAHMGMEGPYPPGHPANFRGQGPGPGMGGDMGQMQAHQQAWMRMQQEYFENKSKHMQQQRSQQAAMMGCMGPQHPMNGPPPPYYSTMGGKRQPVNPMGMVGSPTSPTSMMDGGVDPIMYPSARSRPGMPMDPQTMEAMGAAGFGPGPSGMPPHSMSMGMMPGMEGPMMPGMGPQGPMVSGPMMPNRAGVGPVMGSSSGVNVVSSTSARKNSVTSQVTLHRAGNPEQFTPDPNSANINSTGSKPPPSYAQAQKRKRDDMEDPFKNLQPTPSPTPLTYLNQFEGQELTITKQLNSAFRDSSTGTGSGAASSVGGMTPHDSNAVPPPSSHPHNTQFSSPASNPVNSPMPHNNNSSSNNPGANPPSVKNPMSNSSQTSSTGHLGSPGTLHHPPGQSPLSGANMRLSHFDPAPANGLTGPSSTATSNSGSMSSAPATPTAMGAKQPAGSTQGGTSSMSNITSATLANLAKGVENLSNQMQQSMVHGGPFHSIQVQGQVGNSAGNNSSGSSTTCSAPATAPQVAVTTAQPGSTPSTPKQYINNTNISQVNNFFGVNRDAGQGSMEVHAMGTEGPHISMAGAGNTATMTSVSSMNGGMPPTAAGIPKDAAFRETQLQQQQQQQQQQQMMMASGGGMGVSMSMTQMQNAGPMPPSNTPMASMQPGMPPSSQVKSPPYSCHQPHPHPLPHPSMSTGMQQPPGMSNAVGGAGNRMTSPPFPSNSVGNANVHIQPKAPNTIQYLPANPPPTQQTPPQSTMPMGAAGPPAAKRAATEMEMMARYSSPMDMKGNPSSTLQYFPSSPPNHSMRPHPAAGPHSAATVPPMQEFTPQQTMEMQQAMMMRGGAPGGPGPQDFGPMGPMGQGMHPGMSMGPNGPVPSSMHSPMGMDRMDMSGMGSPMDPVMMGPGASALRHASVLGPGGAGSMDPMSSPMPSMMGPGGAPHSASYPTATPSGYMANGQPMMMGQPMQGPGPAGHPSTMPSMPMSHGSMPRMPAGPSGMRMQMPGGGAPGGGGTYSAQYQQFQQQLYAQGRPRQMSPHMMGAGPAGQPYMGMMPPNMPGPS